MKKYFALFTAVLLFISCNKDETPNNGSPDNPATVQLFNIEEVPSITLEFALADWNKLLTNYDQNPMNEKKVVARFRYSGNGGEAALDSIGLRLRGNTSRRRPEGVEGQLHNAASPDWHHCHFGLDFPQYRDGQRFAGKEKLVLKWFKDDAAYAREIYSYDLFRRAGVWAAPRASYCRVTIKVDGDADAANYGVYAMIESVDEDYIASRQNDWGMGVGYLWKGGYDTSGHNANFVSTASMGVENVEMDASQSEYFAYDLKTRKNEIAAAKAGLTDFITQLNSRTGNDFKQWIAQQMDVDLFLKTYAVNVMVGMWDDYWVNGNNFYFYFAGNGKAYFIPYDYDNTLGTSQLMPNSGTRDPLAWGSSTTAPLITKLLAISDYRQKYKDYISELIDPANGLFAAAASKARIQQWHAMISPYVSNDTGEDMVIQDVPASWGNAPFYRLLSGNGLGGASGAANWFETKAGSVGW